MAVSMHGHSNLHDDHFHFWKKTAEKNEKKKSEMKIFEAARG